MGMDCAPSKAEVASHRECGNVWSGVMKIVQGRFFQIHNPPNQPKNRSKETIFFAGLGAGSKVTRIFVNYYQIPDTRTLHVSRYKMAL
jgi:hypothetical protein